MFRTNNWISYFLILFIILLSIGSVDVSAGSIDIGTSINKFKILPVDKYTNKYDIYYKKYTKRNFSFGINWKWFKAQTHAESGFKERVVSPVGAKGLMQIMDPTMNDIINRSNYIPNEVFTARWNIAAGIFYDAGLYRGWKSKRPELDRLALMFASYNAGMGNILKAQKVCSAVGGSDCNIWRNIKAQGHNVRSWKEEETIGYVDKIFKVMDHGEYFK